MSDKLHARLAELETEYQEGKRVLADLDAKRQALSQTLLRIEGAMQVLREMIGEDAAPRRASRPHEGVDPARSRR